MKAVKIFWKDSLSSSSWELMKDAKEVKPVCVTSYGFVIDETEDYVTIAQNYGVEPEQVCNTMCIPRCSITSIVDITEYDWNNPKHAVDPNAPDRQ